MKTTDIGGAQVGTLKKGMSTNRHVDPQNPAYANPGHSEPEPLYSRNTQHNKSKTVTQSQFMATVKSRGAEQANAGVKDIAPTLPLDSSTKAKPEIRRPSQQSNQGVEAGNNKLPSRDAPITP